MPMELLEPESRSSRKEIAVAFPNNSKGQVFLVGWSWWVEQRPFHFAGRPLALRWRRRSGAPAA